ncbi:MAG: hypothetical protein GXN91_03310 [Epsilonproteobacteria bacterium]|nr:hypothetical protein [Campylobacterota bacterium]
MEERVELNKIFKSKAYEELVKKNNYNTIEFLLREGIEFSIVAYTNVIDFEPPIPKEIIEFDKLALFLIANYTFESAKIDEDNFYIEAGFGVENFGSFLTIPLEAIHQILIKDTILTISYFEPINKKEILEKLDSMSILLNNPENLKLLKKKKRNKS